MGVFILLFLQPAKKPCKIFGFIKAQSTQAYFYKKKVNNLVGRLFCWYLMSPGDSSSEKSLLQLCSHPILDIVTPPLPIIPNKKDCQWGPLVMAAAGIQTQELKHRELATEEIQQSVKWVLEI